MGGGEGEAGGGGREGSAREEPRAPRASGRSAGKRPKARVLEEAEEASWGEPRRLQR